MESLIGKNVGQSTSPYKCLSLFDEDLKSALNALAPKIKKEVASEFKQSVDEKFNHLKELFQKMKSYTNRIEGAKEHTSKT